MHKGLNQIAAMFLDTLEGNNWTGITIQHALLDVTREEAVHRFSGSHLNIAELVAHLNCWNKVMLERLDGQNFQPSPEEDFPRIDRLSESQWEELKLGFYRSFHLLAGKLENKDDAILDEPMFEGASGAYRNLHGQVAHLHYHLGQIVLLKKLQR